MWLVGDKRWCPLWVWSRREKRIDRGKVDLLVLIVVGHDGYCLCLCFERIQRMEIKNNTKKNSRNGKEFLYIYSPELA